MASCGKTASQNPLAAFSHNEVAADFFKGNIDLSLSLLTAFDEPKNTFFSPASITFAMAMTYLGANGETKAEMTRVLKFPQTCDDGSFHQTMSELSDSLIQKKPGLLLKMANRLFVERKYNVLDEFLSSCKENYKADPQMMDFINSAEPCRLDINQWVKEATENKIQDLIPAGAINGLTRLVLVNAIYFKGDWAKKFRVEKTKDEPFFTSETLSKNVPTMRMKSKFKFGSSDPLDASALELPYVSDTLSMVIILPNKRTGLREMMTKLKSDVLLNFDTSFRMRSQEVNVSLPKFKMEYSVNLKEKFSTMGMSNLFSALGCDLSGIDGSKELFVSDIFHKAFIEVNEEGSEAAAATVVRMTPMCRPPPPPMFKADHPFVFLIKSRITGQIVFLGKLLDPQC